MIQNKDEIVDIPPNRIRYFGGTGKMLLPSPATIAALINKIPANKLLTTDLLRKQLAEQFDVDGVCPVTTKKSLQAIARSSDSRVPYWRVISKSGELIASFPGGVEDQAERLKDEGFTLDSSGKAPKVKHFTENLIRLA